MHYPRLKIDSDFIWRFLIALCSIGIIMGLAEEAFAASASAGGDVIGTLLCRVTQNLTGGIAKGIATIAIFSAGIGMFLGKINLPLALTICVAVAIIFGAPTFLQWMTGDSGGCNVLAPSAA